MIDIQKITGGPGRGRPDRGGRGGAGGDTGGGTGGGTDTGDTTDPWRPTTTRQAQWEHSKKYPGAAANVQQEWLRDPRWGGHVIWNPDLGFQDFPSMAKLYAEAGGPVSQEQMMGWGLTPQMGSDWTEYYGDRKTAAQHQKERGAGGWSLPEGIGINATGPVLEGEGYTGGYTMPEAQPFPYPEQWGTASDVFTRFARGLPTDTTQWWEAQQAPFERRITDQVKQMAEQMGLGGLRYSTPMTHQIADITGRESSNLWSQLAQTQLGLTEAAKNRGMQAAGALTGLGQQYLQAPQDWAQRMYGMGSGMTGLGQQGLNRAYQDWMRMTPEANPWFQQAMGYSGMQSQMMPQQYQPSFLSQLLGGLMGGAGIAGGLGWSPFG